jgi:hypothetical protein
LNGVCTTYCHNAPGNCPSTFSASAFGDCVQLGADPQDAEPQDQICTFECTPIPDNCPSGGGCHVFIYGGLDHGMCAANGTAQPGQPCTTGGDCVAGADCTIALTGPGMVCAHLCLTNADCTSPSQCTTDRGTLPLNGKLYEYCTLVDAGAGDQ